MTDYNIPMHIKITVDNAKIEIVNDKGEIVGNWGIENYYLFACPAELVKFGLQCKQEIDAMLANKEVQRALRDAMTSTQQ